MLKLPQVPKYHIPLRVPLKAASAWLKPLTKLVCWMLALTSGVITKNQGLVSSMSFAFILASVRVNNLNTLETDTVTGFPAVPHISPSSIEY